LIIDGRPPFVVLNWASYLFGTPLPLEAFISTRLHALLRAVRDEQGNGCCYPRGPKGGKESWAGWASGWLGREGGKSWPSGDQLLGGLGPHGRLGLVEVGQRELVRGVK
jgi:hypothetical protein